MHTQHTAQTDANRLRSLAAVHFWAVAVLACSTPQTSKPPAAWSDVTDASALSDAVLADIQDAASSQTVLDWEKLLMTAICTRGLKCSDPRYYATVDGCVAANLARNADEWSLVVAAVEAGHVAFHPEFEADCLAELASTPCSVGLGYAACRKVFSGDKADGQPCAIVGECQSQYCKKDHANCALGTCVSPGGAGEPCNEDGYACQVGFMCAGGTCVAAKGQLVAGKPCTRHFQCAEGLRCLGTTGGNQCIAPAGVGQACTADACQPGLYCQASSGGAACAVQQQAGEACKPSPFAGWFPGPCASGLACVAGAAGATCQPLGGNGDVCSADSQCAGVDLLCVKTASGAGTCALPGGAGSPCNDAGLSQNKPLACLPPLACVSGTCTTAPVEGEACTATCAVGFVCGANNACEGLPAAGQPCYFGAYCAPGLSCIAGPSGGKLLCHAPTCTASQPDADALSDVGTDATQDASPDATVDIGPAAVCGNGTCEKGESNFGCPGDCQSIGCGNGKCLWNEDSAICPTDCYCGNKTCDQNETKATCAVDCSGPCGDGKCDGAAGENLGKCPADCFCGNGTCEESVATCPQDCCACGDGLCSVAQCGETAAKCPGDCPVGCGDGKCDPKAKEDLVVCPADCYCGNGTCEDEGFKDCPQDCCVCGDGFCNPDYCKETSATCAADCPASCGNGKCEASLGEHKWNCEKDCFCGDGICAIWDMEEDKFCPADCCVCGNGTCDMKSCKETAGKCPADCAPGCGDGVCKSGESATNCPADCCKCGDGKCTDFECGESEMSCAADCSGCGNGVCSPGETKASCPYDCCNPGAGFSGCGDGFCAGAECAEDGKTCPTDCP